MKSLTFIAMLVSAGGCFAQIDERRPEPRIVLQQFEPPYEQFYDWRDKFKAPEAIVAPRILYPLRPISIGAFHGEAVILVQIDGEGFPMSLAVLYGTQEPLSEAAISALKKARWKGSLRPVWFYYKAVFTPE
jgi:hypothetical protein